MNTKLTLNIEQSVIEKAKRYAQEQGRSLSDVVESYLKSITADISKSKIPKSTLVDSLRGSFKADKDFNYKDELSKILSQKHSS